MDKKCKFLIWAYWHTVAQDVVLKIAMTRRSFPRNTMENTHLIWTYKTKYRAHNNLRNFYSNLHKKKEEKKGITCEVGNEMSSSLVVSNV